VVGSCMEQYDFSIMFNTVTTLHKITIEHVGKAHRNQDVNEMFTLKKFDLMSFDISDIAISEIYIEESYITIGTQTTFASFELITKP